METVCKCKDRSLIDYYETFDNFFFQNIEIVEKHEWSELYRCKSCGQLWKIDVWDKYQERFVVKINDYDNWKNIDDIPLIKDLMVNARGGLLDQKCIWINCGQKRVKGAVYCIDHLYECGVRR